VPHLSLGRRAFAELLGTLLLVATVVGSGIAGDRLSDSVGLALLINAAATAGILAALILTLGPVSGAHLNPLVTAVDAWFGGRPWSELGPYAVAQTAGAIGGAVLANGMFDVGLLGPSGHDRFTGPHLLAEVVATFGLVLLVFTLVRTGRTAHAAASVAGYIGAAYFFTSSTSFANPAVTVGRTFTDTFAGIAPASAPGFVLGQIAGAALAVGAVLAITPHPAAADGEAIEEPDRA
jgi:arsenate reductase